VKSWTEGERVTKASDIWSESRCSSGIRRRREREQPITHWEEKEWRSPLSLSEATTCEWCVKKRDEDFFSTVRRCIVVICTVVQFLSVCGMHPTTIHHEYTRPVTTASDHDEEARVWMKDWRRESFKMSVWYNQGVEWDAKSLVVKWGSVESTEVSLIDLWKDQLTGKDEWLSSARSSCVRIQHIYAQLHATFNSYECHSRSQRLSQCNSVLYLLNHCLLQAQAQDEGKLVNRWENNDAPCDSLDLWPPYKPTLITTTFHIIPTQVP